MTTTVENLNSLRNMEREAWDCFEVGSYEETIHLYQQNKNSSFLLHLSVLSAYESGVGNASELIPEAINAKSPIADLALSYIYYNLNNKLEASQKFIEYMRRQDKLLCFTILRHGIRVTFESQKYSECLVLMDMDKRMTSGDLYTQERLDCFYYLKKYKEYLLLYKSKYEVLKDKPDVVLRVGLILYSMGKFKESEKIMSVVPGRQNLPSFEERREDFIHIINNIYEYESKPVKTPEELRELGFAYLFNSEYEKAQQVFQQAILVAK